MKYDKIDGLDKEISKLIEPILNRGKSDKKIN